MNSKLICLLLFCLGLISCGLKTRPKAPANTKLPSLTEKHSYPTKHKISSEEEEEEKKKKKK